ncbi:MAG: hypothetical protein MJZ82_05775 [Paludibacteraceae bacterium]|nr:hypothetical protein [Paludibacteraceae bacterium]
MNNLVFKIITGSKTAMIISVASLLLLSTHVHAVAISDKNSYSHIPQELKVTAMQGDDQIYAHWTFWKDPKSLFYYTLLLACKYNSNHALYQLGLDLPALYEGRLHDKVSKFDSITPKLYLLAIQKGTMLKNYFTALHLYDYYSRYDVDSLKAANAFFLYSFYSRANHLSSEFQLQNNITPHDIFEIYYNLLDDEFKQKVISDVEKHMRHWRKIDVRQFDYDTISYIDSPNFRHTIAGSRQSILDDGNIQAYDWLIEQARNDKDNPYAFNECLYFAMLMANRYNYRPAYRHVYEIVRTFYSNDEFSQMDYITMYMLSIYANPDQNSTQCFENLQE